MNRAAGILFVNSDGKVLLMRRTGTDTRGCWGLPGGGIDGDETPEQAARRETLEETGHDYIGELKPWTRRIKNGVDFTTFIATDSFEPTLNDEHDDSGWFDKSTAGNEVKLHPGVPIALMRFDLDELGIAKAMKAGELASPERYHNTLLAAIRITGTGAAYRPTLDEYVWRDPALYLTDEFVERCNGLPVIWEHPKGNMLDSKEFSNRIVGTILLPYIQGDEVWGIAKIYDDDAAAIFMTDVLSTSPGVYLESFAKFKMSEGENLVVEGKPRIIDHIAICPLGVWDKGGEPTGVLNDALNSLNGAIDMADEKDDDKKKGDADKILSALDGVMKRLDAADARMDSWEKAKKDAAEEKEKADKAKADAESEEALKTEREKNELEAKDKGKKDKAKKDEDAEAMDKAKKDAEAEEKKKEEKEKADAIRADSVALRARLAELEARIPVELPNDQRALFVEAQSKAERVAQAFGDSDPRRWANSESLTQYRQRLLTKFKQHSKDWKDVELAEIKGPALDIAEKAIYADAWEAAIRPAIVEGSGMLREVTEKDRSGRNISRFYGDAGACWAPFKQDPRRMENIVTKFN